MTVKEFYDEIGGNYEDVVFRLKNDERITKFLGIFLRDKSFELLRQYIEQNEVESAFREAHNLKGVSANLAFTKLTELASDVTEMLRNGSNFDGAREKFPQLKAEYDKTVGGINNILL